MSGSYQKEKEIKKPAKPIILVFPFDLLAHYIRTIELVKPLKNRYQILFAGSDRYDTLVKKAGYNSFPCKNFDYEKVLQCSKNFSFSWLNQDDLEEVFLDQVRAIDKYQPLAVIGDTAPTIKMACEPTQTRCYSLMNGYMTKYFRGKRILPYHHPINRAKPYTPPTLFDWFSKVGQSFAFSYIHRPFKNIRNKYSLKRFDSYLDELEGDFNLICDVSELFPQNELPDNYRVIGPLFYCGEENEHELIQRIDKNRKTILFNIGSSADFKDFIFINDDGFRKYNIIFAGNTDGTALANHISHKTFINNCAILEKVDLVISHGGNGSIYQALAFGVPVLALPNIFEQEWNVQSLVANNLGASLNGISDRQDIYNLIESWIEKKDEPQFQHITEKINLKKSKENFISFWNTTIN